MGAREAHPMSRLTVDVPVPGRSHEVSSLVETFRGCVTGELGLSGKKHSEWGINA